MLQRFFELLHKDKSPLDPAAAQAKMKKLKASKSILIGHHMVKIERKIAQGGYADIYRVLADDDDNLEVQQRSIGLINIIGAARRQTISIYDVPRGVFALKRMFFQSHVPPMILTREQLKGSSPQNLLLQNKGNFDINDMLKIAFEAEVNILHYVGEHDNIIKLVDHQVNPKADHCFEVYLLLEYCPHGTLFDVIEANCRMGLAGITNETELVSIIYDISNGLRFLHKKKIAHRDLKIENVLKGDDGKWKICDFGSCTQKQHNDGISQQDREAITEEIEKVTTPIYRAPEQIDLFKGYQINQKVDVWALGCIMFTLMYHRPPFLEGEKLAQINGTFRIPKFPEYSEFCTKLLKAMLTVDPTQRASAEQIYTATQNLTDICLPLVNPPDKDGFKFPAEIKRNKELEDFSQPRNIQQAPVPKANNIQSVPVAAFQPVMQNGNASTHTKAQVMGNNQSAEDTSLVDSLLGEAEVRPPTDSQNSIPSSQAHRDFKEAVLSANNKYQPSREQQWAQEFQKMMDMLCNRHIDQPEEHAKPLSEKRIRQSIDGIARDEFLSNRTLCLCIVESLNKPAQVFKDAVSALKFLIYAQRLLLFCPQMFEYCVDAQQMLARQQQNQPILIQDQLSIFKKIHNHWLQVLKKENEAAANDQAKMGQQDPFVIRTVVALSGYLFNKVLMFQEFGNSIDIGLNLRGIVDGAEFMQGSSGNQSLNQQINQKKLIQNPLKVMFLKNLMSLWNHLAVLNDKVLREKQSKVELKLQLGLNMVEEQWQLLVNVSHLFTAFQLQYNLSKGELNAGLNSSFQEFIVEYKQEFHNNVESLHDFVGVLKSAPAIRHLQRKIPDIPINLAIIIDEVVERNLAKYRISMNNHFKIQHMLGVNITIGGMKIPIRFKTYMGFSTECHDKFDVLLCWRSYRDKLGQKYQADDLRDDMPVAGTVGNPQAAGYGQVPRNQPSQQVQPAQPYVQSSLQQRFQSISGRHFEKTSSLVGQVIKMQNQYVPAPRKSTVVSSAQSSEITVKLREAGGSRRHSPNVAHMDIQDVSSNRRQERRAMFNSIDFDAVGIERNESAVTAREPKTSVRPKKNADGLDNRETLSLRASEIDFLKNIDKEGIEELTNHRNSIGKKAPAERGDEGQIDSSSKPWDAQGLQIDPSLLDAFSGPGWQAQNKPQEAAKQEKESAFEPFSSDSRVQRASERDEFFNWGRESAGSMGDSPQLPEVQSEQDKDDQFDQTARFHELPNNNEDDARSVVDQATNNKGEFFTSNTAYDLSKFDSKQSEYLLILNEKNKAIVRKRMLQKQQEYDENLKQFEEEFQKKQEDIIKKEQEAFKKVQEEQLQEQNNLLQRTKSLSKEQMAKQDELEKLQEQINLKKDLFEKQDKDLQENSKRIEKTKKELEDEKMKFQKEKEAEYEKMQQKKERILEIQKKVEADKERTEKEKQEYEQRKQELEKMKEYIQNQEKLLQDQAAQIKKKEEESQSFIQAQQIQQDQQQKQVNSLEPDEFTPDINNKEKNLAVQFIDFILRNRPSQKINLIDLTGLTKIGEGAAANVYKAKYKFTDVAVKQLKVHSLIKDNKLSKEFQREIEALVHMSHPNLVMFMGATADQGHPVIVTEFCEGGTLFEVLHEKKKEIPKITYRQRHQMALDIALGMHFMHSLKQPLMHRDLKSLNILMYRKIQTIYDNGQCKITDFGLARQAGQAGEAMTGMAGTFHWMAPEILENQPYTFKADVYSYGIVLWEILAREPPFADYPPHKIMYNVINYKERPPLEKISPDCPQNLVIIMRACWEQDPEKRPNFSDVIQALQNMDIQN